MASKRARPGGIRVAGAIGRNETQPVDPGSPSANVSSYNAKAVGSCGGHDLCSELLITAWVAQDAEAWGNVYIGKLG